MTECPNCGARESKTIPVWEDPADYDADRHPDYIGCMACHTMVDPLLMPHAEEELPPQAELSQSETARLPIGNQHTNDLSIIEWQCVKGAAQYYGVADWVSIADSTLTCGENVGLMERHGSQNNETSLRKLVTPVETNTDSDSTDDIHDPKTA